MSRHVLSIEGLVSWLERQDLDTTYNYADIEDCLAARYLHAYGLPYKLPTLMDRYGNFHNRLEHVACQGAIQTKGSILGSGNYKSALEVARALIEEQNASSSH